MYRGRLCGSNVVIGLSELVRLCPPGHRVQPDAHVSSLPLLCVRPEVTCRLCCSCLSVLQLLSWMLASG